MIIRRCVESDIDEIYEIEEKSFADPLKKETFLRDLKREDFYCYGLYDEKLVGFVSYDKVLDEAQIISVAVHPDERKKGYGGMLFEKIIPIAKNEGITFFSLEVRSENIPAITLYKRMGFCEVGVRKNYYQNPVCDGLLMDLHI